MMTKIVGLVLMSILSVTQVQSEPPEREYIGDITISAYSIYEGGGENQTTASGNTPTPYVTVATSSEYPFGTRLYIEGIGEVVVEDRDGSLIESGQRIDLFVGDDNANEFGLQTRKVYIVK